MRRAMRAGAAIPTASMADLALLLLIFFLATTLIESQGGPVVALPPAATAEESRREGAVVVRVSRDGTLTLDGREVTLRDLGAAVARERSARPVARLVLFADRALESRTVLAAVAAMRGDQPIPLVLAVDRRPRADEEEGR
jgi:biopolymer transport protein ExbD